MGIIQSPHVQDQGQLRLSSSLRSQQNSQMQLHMSRRTPLRPEPSPAPNRAVPPLPSPAATKGDCYCPTDGDGLTDQQRSTLIILERLFGVKSTIKIPQQASAPSTVNAPPPETAAASTNSPQAPIAWQSTLRFEQYEELSIGAEFTLADGRSAVLSMQYSLSQQIELRSGGQASSEQVVDPLALNLGLGGLTAASRNGQFLDLNGDGQQERLPDLGASGVWLVYDHNDNHQVDGGHELFGPQSGHGFAELKALDDDGNGWLDHRDQGFAQLKLWHQDGRLVPLSEHGVEAIALQWVDSPWRLRSPEGETTALLQRSGAYLKADGSLGAVQQIDALV